jgi:tetratricopeptide (TPR) repeat protein
MIWAKMAALELLAAEPMDVAGRQRFAAVVRRYLGQAGRAPGSWLVVYLQVRAQPAEGLTAWRRVVTEEQNLLGSQPDWTNVSIVAGLWCMQALLESEYGQAEKAAESFRRYQELLLPEVPEQLQTMVDLALLMQTRGRVDWARTEWERAIAGGEPRRTLRARRLLAELFYDQGQPLAAAQTLEGFLKLVQERALPVLDPEGVSPGELRSRMFYFFACHWKEAGNLEEQRRYLELAIQQDPESIDALIGRWSLPNMPEEYRQETRRLIARAQAELERRLSDTTDPDLQASYLNQLAWLVGNTQGDLEQALRWIEKAIELQPENGAFWDTLAHVRYRRGEWEKAVEAQKKAVELEPSSAQLRRQLDFFVKELESRKPQS